MRTFTHNNPNDTTLERDGGVITMTFVNDPFTMDSDVLDFRMTQAELFEKLTAYFEAGQNQDIFDELTIPQQDALWNALLWLDQRNLEV